MPFCHIAQQTVEHYGWLSGAEMLDGLGMAEATPGPLIMVTQFVGLFTYPNPGYRPNASWLPWCPGHYMGHLRAVFFWIFSALLI